MELAGAIVVYVRPAPCWPELRDPRVLKALSSWFQEVPKVPTRARRSRSMAREIRSISAVPSQGSGMSTAMATTMSSRVGIAMSTTTIGKGRSSCSTAARRASTPPTTSSAWGRRTMPRWARWLPERETSMEATIVFHKRWSTKEAQWKITHGGAVTWGLRG